MIAVSELVAKVAILMLAAKECADAHEGMVGRTHESDNLNKQMIDMDRYLLDNGFPSVLRF